MPGVLRVFSAIPDSNKSSLGGSGSGTACSFANVKSVVCWVESQISCGAAFGATLYSDFVRSCASECDVDNGSNVFFSLHLLPSVLDGAGKCW